MKTVIVGGVAGGASTGARLRRLDESAEIVVLERDHYVSFANWRSAPARSSTSDHRREDRQGTQGLLGPGMGS